MDGRLRAGYEVCSKPPFGSAQQVLKAARQTASRRDRACVLLPVTPTGSPADTVAVRVVKAARVNQIDSRLLPLNAIGTIDPGYWSRRFRLGGEGDCTLFRIFVCVEDIAFFHGCIASADLAPIDDVPERINVLIALGLILKVIGVLPDVQYEQRR